MTSFYWYDKYMPLVYITGPTGSGKSTICETLREQGLEAYDTDYDDMRKLEIIDGKEMLTLDIEVLQRMYDTVGDSLVFICGTSSNDLDARNLFSKIILLTIDEAEQRERILHRTNNQYGKEAHQLANAVKWRQVQIDKYQNAGALVIEASQPVKDIIAKIVASAQPS